jgi:hypothetical protein
LKDEKDKRARLEQEVNEMHRLNKEIATRMGIPIAP